jgi:DNA-binding PadR family transcriptional regulator
MRDSRPSLPLQEPTFLILLALEDGEKHGYAIMKAVTELSDARVKLSTGTLYGALNRLLDQGLIAQVDGESGARGKKAYRLTHTGLEVFHTEVIRLRQLLRAVQSQESAGGGQQI